MSFKNCFTQESIWYLAFAAFIGSVSLASLNADNGVNDPSGACAKPNDVSTKACYQPGAGSVTLCTTPVIDPADPDNRSCGQYATYEINQFPDGTKSACDGNTHEVQRDCWRKNTCVAVPNSTTKCMAGPIPVGTPLGPGDGNGGGNYNLAGKIEKNPEGTCETQTEPCANLDDDGDNMDDGDNLSLIHI